MKKQEEYRATFQQRLLELELERGINQLELADAINVKRQTISQYETGKASPKLEGFAALADYFGVSCDYLLGLTDVKTRDVDVKAVVEKYGLSEKALATLSYLTTGRYADDPELETYMKVARDGLNAVLSINSTHTVLLFKAIHEFLFGRDEDLPELPSNVSLIENRKLMILVIDHILEEFREYLSASKKTPTKKKGARKNAQH